MTGIQGLRDKFKRLHTEAKAMLDATPGDKWTPQNEAALGRS